MSYSIREKLKKRKVRILRINISCTSLHFETQILNLKDTQPTGTEGLKEPFIYNLQKSQIYATDYVAILKL